MVSINGYRNFDCDKDIKLDSNDEEFYDQILISDDNIIIIKEFSNQEEVENKWEDVMCFVAGKIQNNLITLKLDEGYLWNIYIVYLVKNNMDLHLKLDIEKNKFCCKKYLIDWSSYKTKDEALQSELPILANIDFQIKEDIYLKDDQEIKKLISSEEVNPIAQYFIKTDGIHKMDINTIIKDMVGLYYDNAKEN